MKALFLFLFILIGCQDLNSNSSDKSRFGPINIGTDPQFMKAYAVLQTKCMNCHTHAYWSSYTSNADWVKSGGRVVPGQARQSNLIIRIINTRATNSNMPQGGGALSDEDYDALVDWIDNIDPNNP